MSDPSEFHDPSDLKQVRHHPAEFVFGLAAFVAALVLAALLPRETSWVGGLSLLKQPAFWPLVSIVGMVLFGACELYWTWRRRRPSDKQVVSAEMRDWAGAIEFAVWFLVYVWLVPALGYLPATLLFCLVLTARLGYRDRRVYLAAALTAIATVVVFKTLLAVKIPGGAAYEYLPAAIRNIMIIYL